MNHDTIIVTGKPADGHQYYGPFDGSNAALEWGKANLNGVEWKVIYLLPPEEHDAD